MIKRLEILNYKVIREAICENLPRVMLICGPNGVGKTTLLDAIGRRSGITEDKTTIIAVAPSTRTWRKEAIQSRWLYGNTVETSDVYNLSSQLGSYSGQFNRNIFSGTRDLWSDDDAKQLVKPLLAKLNAEWTQIVTKEIKELNFVTPEKKWPNPKTVLSSFTEALFEELKYIDTQEHSDQTTKILFESTNRPGEQPLDIDELSSGEKAIFSIFLPIIEEDFRRALGQPHREITIVVDEIEEHLHPSLQLRVLDYMRSKEVDGYQFICTTHSTLLIKAANKTELFHVLPKGATVGNQLKQVTAEVYSLVEVMQDVVLFASGYQRHILCEGYDLAKKDENNVCDSELLVTLLDLSSKEKVVAAGSKSALIAGLKAAQSSLFAPLTLVGITDSDGQSSGLVEASWCHLVLPIYSIESVLLNEQAIVDVLTRYNKTLREVKEAITNAINKAVNDREIQLMRPEEYTRRKNNLSLDDAIKHLAKGDVLNVFEMIPDASTKMQKEKNRINEARNQLEIAIKIIQGKKLYHYLFESLNLKGYSYTHRSFAEQVIKQVRLNGTLTWLSNFEKVVKKGLGNTLNVLLLTPIGDQIKTHPTHGASFQSVRSLVHELKVGDTSYAVLNDGVKREVFAEQLVKLSRGLQEIMPQYQWY